MNGSGAVATAPGAAETFPLEGGLSAALAMGVGLVLVIEGVVIHLWIASRHPLVAWTVTAVNVLTLVWLWREHAASARSTMRVSAEDVEITAGRRVQCRARRGALASAAVATWQSVPPPASDYVNAAKPLDPNVVIRFAEPQEVVLPLGIRRRIARIGVRVTDPQRVVDRILSVP